MSRISRAIERAKRSKSEIAPSESLSISAHRRKLELKPELTTGDGVRLDEMDISHVPLSTQLLAKNRVVSSVFDSKVSAVDAYKMLRTKTLRQMVANQWQVLALTSTAQGEGKSLTALNLALSISQDPNFDAVLVDADLRSPSIHKMLGIDPSAGLYEYLEGTASLEDILISPDISGFGIIPNTYSVENSAEALTGRRMRQLISELRALSSSVIVVVDMPPLVVDDVLAFAPLVDTMLLVFRAGVTSRVDAATVREMTADLPVVGCVLNDAHGPNMGAYY